MPNGIAGWLAERRLSRVLLVGGLLPLGLLGILSAAIVVMTTVLKGWRVAVIDCALALAIVSVLYFLVGGAWPQIAANGVATWSLALLLGALTGAYGSITLAVQALLVLTMLGVSIFHLSIPDPVDFWRDVLERFVAEMSEMGIALGPIDGFLSIAPLLGGLIGASVVISSVVALLIGCSWSGRAGGPALRPMFLQLRLGYVIGGIAAVAGVVTVVTQSALAASLLTVLGVGFALQGLAVVHWFIGERNLPWPVFIPVYGPLFLSNVFAVVNLLLLATIGFVDNWFKLKPTPNRGVDV